MSWEVNCFTPAPAAIKFCQTRDTAFASSKPFTGSMPVARSSPCADAGRLPSCHEFSASGRNVPPSPSNVSTQAWPTWLGEGREVASSASSVTSEGTSVCTSGSRLRSRVSPEGSNRKLPEMPPTKSDDGSNPSGGRVKFVLCRCSRPSTVTAP